MDAFSAAKQRIAQQPRQFAWPPPVGTNLDAWGEQARAAVADLIGAQGARPDPAVKVVSEQSRDGYRLQEVEFRSAPEMVAYGYLLVPDRPNGAGLVCLHGHGPGVDPNVGLAPEDYQHAFGVQSVKLGFTTLAIEMLSFGKRRSSPVPEDPGASTCHRDSTAILHLGETMAGWRVRDARAGLDVLAQTAGVDPGRLGIMGISGGGTVSLLTGIVDERVQATVTSGYFNTFDASILAVDHCVDNYIPGMARLAEMPDLVAALAPRAFFAENGTLDPIFPVEAFRGACAKAQAIYEAHRAADRFGSEIFEGDHFFHGVGAFRFLQEKL